MRVLDERTLDKLARVICDPDGPYERPSWELESLLRRAGWTDPPAYYGSPRVHWLLEALIERRHREGDIERLICRACDPLEYDGQDTAEAFRVAINQVLEPEQLIVKRVAGRPVLGHITAAGEASFGAPPDLERRLRELVIDQATGENLLDRIRETEICTQHGAYTFAIIGIGSFVEGLLQAVLSEREPTIIGRGFRDGKGEQIKERYITLQYLIDEARRLSWIQLDAAEFMHKVRDYRNYVHPKVQMRNPQTFDQDSVMLCWAPVQAILNDVEQHLAQLTDDEAA